MKLSEWLQMWFESGANTVGIAYIPIADIDDAIREVAKLEAENEKLSMLCSVATKTADASANVVSRLSAENEALRMAGQESATMLRKFLGFGPSTKLEILIGALLTGEDDE